MSEIEPPDTPREVTYSVAEHEVLLSFNDDWNGEAFMDWWNTEGWDAFEKWAEKNAETYDRR